MRACRFRLNVDRRVRTAATAALLAAALAACSPGPAAVRGDGIDPKYGVRPSPRVVAEGEPVPPGGGRYQVGKPYLIAGRWYVPREDPAYDRTGTASWYGRDFHGRLTANGEIYDRFTLSAAHPTLPIPSYARVTNLQNGRSVVVRVNNRGPYHGDRLIDLSERAAEVLGFKGEGIATVRVQYVGRAPLSGGDTPALMATLRVPGQPEAPAGERIALAVAVGSAAPGSAKPSATAPAAPPEIPRARSAAEPAPMGAAPGLRPPSGPVPADLPLPMERPRAAQPKAAGDAVAVAALTRSTPTSSLAPTPPPPPRPAAAGAPIPSAPASPAQHAPEPARSSGRTPEASGLAGSLR